MLNCFSLVSSPLHSSSKFKPSAPPISFSNTANRRLPPPSLPPSGPLNAAVSSRLLSAPPQNSNPQPLLSPSQTPPTTDRRLPPLEWPGRSPSRPRRLLLLVALSLVVIFSSSRQTRRLLLFTVRPPNRQSLLVFPFSPSVLVESPISANTEFSLP
ncbi:uncharacterized protein DS421_1g31210 [Arachis hypogaea]|nr:proline-rich receptor-like protein kinase PERK9 isoform X2 [Arachis hypogaea]QHO51470.1 uncharacterized protein DS421_1g31210 [Arachis hypogaea]